MSAADSDPFAAKRAAMREEFFARHFLLGGWIGGTDTYKRTMWAAVPDVALARAGYALTMRKGLPEPGADNQLIMAGHEAMLAQWFHRPLQRADIELAGRWFSEHAGDAGVSAGAVATPSSTASPATTSICPIDVWGFPGGQTFLAGRAVPVLRGPGRRRLLSRAGHVPLFRPDHPGDQGPPDEARHAARRRVRPALRPERADQSRPAAGPLRRRPRPAHLQRHGRVPLSRTVPLASAPSATR